MNSFKKIFAVTILAINVLVIARSDDDYERKYAVEREQAQQSTAIWAGVIGAVAGTALGFWLGSLDSSDTSSNTQYSVEYYSVERFDYSYDSLSPIARRIKAELDSLAKYGHNFELHDYSAGVFFSPVCEQEIITNLYKLGFRLDQINAQFYNKLAQENKVLSDAGYSIWWHSLNNLERQKDLYLTTSNQLITYFNRHEIFIRGCQIINFYDKLPVNAYDLPMWIRSQYSYNHQYPFITFKNKVEADRQALISLQQRYSGQYVVERARCTQRILDHILGMLYNSHAYQQEFAQKQQNEQRYELEYVQNQLHVQQQRAEQEQLIIAIQHMQAVDEADRLAAERDRLERERRDW